MIYANLLHFYERLFCKILHFYEGLLQENHTFMKDFGVCSVKMPCPFLVIPLFQRSLVR